MHGVDPPNVLVAPSPRGPARRVCSCSLSGTTYAAGDIVKYTDTTVTPNLTSVYVSMQASNTGNTPGATTGQSRLCGDHTIASKPDDAGWGTGFIPREYPGICSWPGP